MLAMSNITRENRKDDQLAWYGQVRTSQGARNRRGRTLKILVTGQRTKPVKTLFDSNDGPGHWCLTESRVPAPWPKP